MRTAVTVFLAFVTTACTHPAEDSAPATASSVEATPPALNEPVPANAKGRVIATLVTHDAKVSILTGQRVVVRKTDGTLVADGISVDELRAVDPLLHILVRNAVASSDGSYIDASYHRVLAD